MNKKIIDKYFLHQNVQLSSFRTFRNFRKIRKVSEKVCMLSENFPKVSESFRKRATFSETSPFLKLSVRPFGANWRYSRKILKIHKILNISKDQEFNFSIACRLKFFAVQSKCYGRKTQRKPMCEAEAPEPLAKASVNAPARPPWSQLPPRSAAPPEPP